MKVAIVLMKGFDGCGVSRFAIEHQKYLRSNSKICDIYAFADNTYCREKAHKDKEVIFYKKFTDVDFSNYDILVLNSYPKDFSEEDFNYYKSLKCIKVAMMHEILRANVSRIKNVWDWIFASDLVSSFSDTMDFVKDLKDKGFDMNRYFSFKMAVNDEDMEKLYNGSLNADKKNRLIYFGRWTSMKDPSRLYSYKTLDIGNSLDYSMIGIERSIGAFYDIFKNDLCDAPKLSFLENINDFESANIDKNKVGVFPPVNRDTALQILNNSMFGCSFYRLKDNKINNLGNRMEFTQIEISCVCLPVFDISWGKNTFDSVTGKSFYELDSNAVYSDSNNLNKSLEEMEMLINNKDIYNIRRKNIYDLVKRNYGSKSNIDYFYNIIMERFDKYGRT